LSPLFEVVRFPSFFLNAPKNGQTKTADRLFPSGEPKKKTRNGRAAKAVLREFVVVFVVVHWEKSACGWKFFLFACGETELRTLWRRRRLRDFWGFCLWPACYFHRCGFVDGHLNLNGNRLQIHALAHKEGEFIQMCRGCKMRNGQSQTSITR